VLVKVFRLISFKFQKTLSYLACLKFSQGRAFESHKSLEGNPHNGRGETDALVPGACPCTWAALTNAINGKTLQRQKANHQGTYTYLYLRSANRKRKGNPHSRHPKRYKCRLSALPRVLFYRWVQIIYATWGNNTPQTLLHLAMQSKRAARGK